MELSIHLLMTLDGISQAPGAPDEDTRGGFTRGGCLGSVWDAKVEDGPDVILDSKGE